MDTKYCALCDETKPREAFYRRAAAASGLQSGCKDCSRERCRKWHAANPERVRWRNKISRYRLSQEQYETMLAAQGGTCVFCDKPPIQVDHDHACCPGPRNTCGKCTRALLCAGHNTGLGAFGDDPALLRAAAEYIEHHRAKAAV